MRVKVRAGWRFCEQDIGVNNKTIPIWPLLPIKLQTLGIHEEVKKAKEGGAAVPGPILCIFMGEGSVFEGRARPCPLPDPWTKYQQDGLSHLRRRDVGVTLIKDEVKGLAGALKVQIRRTLELMVFLSALVQYTDTSNLKDNHIYSHSNVTSLSRSQVYRLWTYHFLQGKSCSTRGLLLGSAKYFVE